MSDLEHAAHQAVEAVGALGSSVRKARESCSGSAHAVTAARERLAKDRAALGTALEALAETLDDLAAHVPPAVNGAENALIALGRTSEECGVEWTPLMETEVQGLDAVATESREAAQALHGWAEGAASQGVAAVSRAEEIDEALRQLLDEAEQATSIRLPAWLVEVGEGIEDGAAQAREVMAEACPALLEKRQAVWEARLADVRGVLEKVFADMKGHAEATAGYALEQGSGLVEEALERRGGEVSSVEMELRELDAEVARARAQLEQGVEELMGDLRGADRAVETTLQAWRATVERWRETGYP